MSVLFNRRAVTVDPSLVFEEDALDQDILRLISGYLRSKGLDATAMILQDESGLQLSARKERASKTPKLKAAILEGDWEQVKKLGTKAVLKKHHKAFLYVVYKQEYMELIER